MTLEQSTSASTETDSALSAWSVDAADFPVGGMTADVLRFAVRFALVAPSTHNTQPWQFNISDAHVDLYADTSRGLPVVDPDDRELVMSCGAALFNLRAALARFGYAVRVENFPAPKDPALLARLRLVGSHEPTPEDDELFAAMTSRHTNRSAFNDTLVPTDALQQLVADANAEGAWLHVVTNTEAKVTLADLVGDADRRQMSDRRFRRELANWMRPNRSERPDGMRGYALGLGDAMSIAEPLMIRTFDYGSGKAARDRDIAMGSAALAVLGSTDDDPLSWLRTGQALERVLLRSTAHQIAVGFLNQPVEVDALRAEVARVTGSVGYPQLILRLGYATVALPEPRRDLADVLLPGSE